MYTCSRHQIKKISTFTFAVMKNACERNCSLDRMASENVRLEIYHIPIIVIINNSPDIFNITPCIPALMYLFSKQEDPFNVLPI